MRRGSILQPFGDSMSRTVYLNGAYLPEDQAQISIFDRGFLMADGVYEVTSVLDGKLIDFGKQEEVNTKELIHELLLFIDDVVDELGSRQEINYIYRMLENGTGADRQLRVYEETGDLKKVVDYIVQQTNQGLD